MAYNARRRNIIGDICTFVLSLVISVFAIVAVVLVEGLQSDWGRKFPMEKDDITRRTIIAIIGSAIQGLIIYNI